MSMDLVETVTVGAGGASTITFNSIPQDGTDLCLVYSFRNTTGGNGVYLRFNGSSSGYAARVLEGSGTAVSTYLSSVVDSGYIGEASTFTNTANMFTPVGVYIPNYAASNGKSWSSDYVKENNNTASYMASIGGTWSSGAAITSITLTHPTGTINLAQNSTVSLYKITKGSDGITSVS